MEQKQTPQAATLVAAPAPPGLKLADVYYIIFRRKWLILAFMLVGVLGSLAFYFLQKPLYGSEAKLLVRYIIDTKSVEAGADAQLRNPDSTGESIINSELEILTSLDLCRNVAEFIGPEKILGRVGQSNVVAAAVAIYKGLSVANPKKSNIIKVRFLHRDPSVCRDVLRQVVDAYFQQHIAIHRSAGSYDEILTRQSGDLLLRIRQNEEALRKLKAQAHVVSLEDAKKTYSEQMTHLRKEILELQAQLVEYNVLASVYQNNQPTNSAPAAKEDAGEVIPSAIISEYRTLSTRMEALRNKEFDLTSEFTEENPLVKRVREQIADTKTRIKDLEAEHPKLTSIHIPPAATPGSVSSDRPDPARIPAMVARMSVLTNEFAIVRAEATALDAVESQITDLQRRLQLDEQNYRRVVAGLEAARFNDILSGGKISNIQAIQNPSAPSLDTGKRAKWAAMILFGALATGFGLAFGIELFLNRSVRRAKDIESRFRVPLFMSIPRLGLNGHAMVLPLAVESPEVPASRVQSVGDLRQTWANDHPLRPFIDGLRDRTLIHFDGDPHKPKLIGVTSCSAGVGVTSLAAGLAGALSETGEGNVLLVNLNFDDQAIHPFYRGELACGLTEALELDKRSNGMVLQNLYVASAGNLADAETRNLSKQLARIVPKLRVSDYDYIVFDLPPTTPTSMTARLAGLMDLVMLVVESEKDSQDTVAQATQMLSRSKARVSAVLNKVRDPVPRWLHNEA